MEKSKKTTVILRSSLVYRMPLSILLDPAGVNSLLKCILTDLQKLRKFILFLSFHWVPHLSLASVQCPRQSSRKGHQQVPTWLVALCRGYLTSIAWDFFLPWLILDSTGHCFKVQHLQLSGLLSDGFLLLLVTGCLRLLIHTIRNSRQIKPWA